MDAALISVFKAWSKEVEAVKVEYWNSSPKDYQRVIAEVTRMLEAGLNLRDELLRNRQV